VSRFGNDGPFRVESAKMLATFLHMMQGTPYIYQGEEIGMTNVRFDSIDQYRDIETLNMYRESVARGENLTKIMAAIYAKGRDNARTPMHWNDTANAGFTTGTPWIAVNPNFTEIHAEQAVTDPNSIFHYYKKLIKLRKTYDIVVYGSYRLIAEDHPEIYAYIRTFGNEKLLVILNFYAGTPVFQLPEDLHTNAPELLISNYTVDEKIGIQEIELRPYEARVYRFTGELEK
jgi:oligo-1,6-glucosidase